MIVCSGLLVVPQMVIRCSAKKVTDWRSFWHKFCARVERFDYQRIVFIFVCDSGQVSVDRWIIRLELDGLQKFLLGLRKFSFLHQCLPKSAVKFGIVGLRR